MYRCGQCNRVIPAKRTQLRIAVTQPVTFPFRAKVNKTWDGKIKDDPGGRGTQIVKEIPVCFRCNEDYKEAQKQVAAQ